jgi:hypothetical protein
MYARSQFVKAPMRPVTVFPAPTEKRQSPGNWKSFSYGTKTNAAGYSMCEVKWNEEEHGIRKKGKVCVEHSQLHHFL